MRKTEFIDWKGQLCTQQLLKELEQKLTELKDGWIEGIYTEESSDGTVQQNARYLGQGQAILAIIEAIKEGHFVEFNDEEIEV